MALEFQCPFTTPTPPPKKDEAKLHKEERKIILQANPLGGILREYGNSGWIRNVE
jgi:hypothetical protein